MVVRLLLDASVQPKLLFRRATNERAAALLLDTETMLRQVLASVFGRIGVDAARERLEAMQQPGEVIDKELNRSLLGRTQQQRYGQWFLGKSLHGFCPMGPWLVTADEVGDVTEIGLVTRVNGEVRQKAKVSDLIFDIPTLIEAITMGRTLEPGDLIATGTPSGVGLGFKPPKFLKKGDVVAITFDRIGTLENKVG
jgi:hypothetical protein